MRRDTLSRESLPELLSACDAVVVQGLLMERFPGLARVSVPLVVDLYDPMLLEGLHLFTSRTAERRQYSHDRLLALTLAQLHRGDFFLVANRAQRDLYLGMLLAVNRVNPAWADGGQKLERLFGIVPAGLPATPVPAGPPVLRGVRPGFDVTTPILLWAGGLWDWTDPLTLVKAMAIVHREVPEARLILWGTRHPNPEVVQPVMPQRVEALARELGLLGSVVHIEEWVPYEERGRWLAEADIGVTLSRPSLETRFAHRTRVLDYLWAGVPVVTTSGDPLSRMIRRDGLGTVVPPSRPRVLARELVELIRDPARREAIRERIAAVRPSLTWDRAAGPLVRFLRSPRVDATRGSVAFLGPLASLLAADRPLAGPLVKTGVSLARDGMWATVRKASRAGARALGLAQGGAR